MALFADTGYWVALLDRKDSLHDLALRLSVSHRRALLVTAQLVIVEVLKHFSGAGAHARLAACDLVVEIGTAPQTQVVAADDYLLDAALMLYRAQYDKAWSLVDCASFVVCEREAITEALSHDRHFEQAGIRALLREP